jgi:adenine phosphoribosyltransferase
MDVFKYIAEIPDFPKKGILFYDITPMMANPEVYNYTIDKMVELIKPHNPTKILGAESRGFFFAPAIALKMGLPFVPVRKKGKLPRETIDVNYDLEYGVDTLCVHKSDINKNDKLAIVDDILATGGTAEAICKMADEVDAEVACLAFFMELDFLKGRDRLNNRKVVSMFTK